MLPFTRIPCLEAPPSPPKKDSGIEMTRAQGAGHLVIADQPKPTSAQALKELKAAGVRQTVMLTGDAQGAAQAVAQDLRLGGAACLYFAFSIRLALRIASTDTPTSANTAAHILAMPTAESTSTNSFTATPRGPPRRWPRT